MTNQMTFDLKKNLNRAILFTAFPTGKPLNFIVYFNKRNSGLQFDIHSKSPLIKDRVIEFNMYRNLETCKFCNVFFNLESLKNQNYDYKGKFSGINSVYEKYIFSFMKEKLDLQLSDDSRNKSRNYLLILGYKLHSLGEDLIFFFFQRKIYDHIARINTIRTAALQFSTPRGLEVLDKYVENYENTIQKATNVPSFMIEPEK